MAWRAPLPILAADECSRGGGPLVVELVVDSGDQGGVERGIGRGVGDHQAGEDHQHHPDEQTPAQGVQQVAPQVRGVRIT